MGDLNAHFFIGQVVGDPATMLGFLTTFLHVYMRLLDDSCFLDVERSA